MAIVDQLIAVFGYELRNQDVPGKWKKGIDGAEKSAASAAKNLERRIADVARTAARVGTIIGTAIGTAASAVGVGAIRVSAQFEKFETSLTTIEGSADKAKASMAWIKDFAVKTPYEMQELTDAFIRLKAYGMDPMDGTMKALGDLSSAMGKPLMDSVEMFADATSFQFERLRSFGITTKQEGDKVTFAWTENGKSLTKTVKKNSEEVAKFLRSNFARFDGAMDLQSRTWNGIVSNMSDAWDQFLLAVGQAGVFDFAKSKLEGFMQRVQQWQADGTLDKWAERFSGAFEGIIAAAEWAAYNIAGHIDFIMKAFEGGDDSKAKERLQWIIGAFGALIWAAWPAGRVIAGLAVAIDDVLNWAQGDPSKFGDLIDWFEKVTGASEPLATALAAVAGGLALLAFMYPFGMIKFLTRLVAVAGGHATVTLMATAIKALAGSFGMLSGMGLLKMLGKGSIAALIATAFSYAGVAAYNETQNPHDLDAAERARVEQNKAAPGESVNDMLGITETPEEKAAKERYRRAIYDFYGQPVPSDAPTSGIDELGAIFQNFMNANGKTTPQAGAAAVMEDHRVQSDQRNQSVNVDVGGVRVEVQSPDAAPGATGAAVGAAIGGAASTAVPAATRNEAPILQ